MSKSNPPADADVQPCAEHCPHDPKLMRDGLCRFEYAIVGVCGHRCDDDDPIHRVAPDAERHEFKSIEGENVCYHCGQPQDAAVHTALPERIYGWITGSQYQERGYYEGGKGKPNGEPWYKTVSGQSWSAYDVSFFPDHEFHGVSHRNPDLLLCDFKFHGRQCVATKEYHDKLAAHTALPVDPERRCKTFGHEQKGSTNTECDYYLAAIREKCGSRVFAPASADTTTDERENDQSKADADHDHDNRVAEQPPSLGDCVIGGPMMHGPEPYRWCETHDRLMLACEIEAAENWLASTPTPTIADVNAWKCYEIIDESGVICVVSDDSRYENLLHEIRDCGSVIAVGEISQADFDRYGDDNDWTEPISVVRWAPTIKTVLELTLLRPTADKGAGGDENG